MKKIISETNDCLKGNINKGDFIRYESTTYPKFLNNDSTIVKVVKHFENKFGEKLVRVIHEAEVQAVEETKSGKTVSIIIKSPHSRDGNAVFCKGLKSSTLFC